MQNKEACGPSAYEPYQQRSYEQRKGKKGERRARGKARKGNGKHAVGAVLTCGFFLAFVLIVKLDDASLETQENYPYMLADPSAFRNMEIGRDAGSY
jgi:hypothetical protein